jgi:rare lipoprotein A
MIDFRQDVRFASAVTGFFRTQNSADGIGWLTLRMNRRSACVLALAAIIEACGKKKARVRSVAAAPTAAVVGSTERGMASWYGRPYHGRAAADGEIYDMETMVAAHRTLPFQTRVRVRNLSNDKAVEVRIIDRGPFVGGRIIDLSHAAAQAIDLIGPGVAQVELTIVAAPVSAEPAYFAVQVGAFRDKANADRLERTMVAAYGAGKAIQRGGEPPLWRVLAGRETSVEAAESLAVRIREEQKMPQAFVVRLDP